MTTIIETQIPFRLDRLPWSVYIFGGHSDLIIVAALGCSWILDGLNVTILGIIGSVLKREDTLNLNETQIGAIATSYLIGCVIGSLFFGYFGDRYGFLYLLNFNDSLGRKRLFMTTPVIYIISTLLTSCCWDFGSIATTQFFSGFGVGGEYSAVNSTIDELIPARLRGTVDLIVMGTYWLGGILGASMSIALLNPSFMSFNIGWRVFFFFGGTLGIGILMLRRLIPESPRWLLTHNRAEDAERVISGIENQVGVDPYLGNNTLRLDTDKLPSFFYGILTILRSYFSRFSLGTMLMIAQTFFYNSIFFTYSLVLYDYYDVHPDRTGVYLITFCIGNYLGPLILSSFFDKKRRLMIALTYSMSGLLLILFSILFIYSVFSALTHSLFVSFIFFFASSAASSAYLTVSEIFPVEIRTISIALCYSIGTAVGGSVGPVLFGSLIESKDKITLSYGFVLAACLMIIAAIFELIFGIDAEQKSLESIAPPLSSFTDSLSVSENENVTLLSQHR